MVACVHRQRSEDFEAGRAGSVPKPASGRRAGQSSAISDTQPAGSPMGGAKLLQRGQLMLAGLQLSTSNSATALLHPRHACKQAQRSEQRHSSRAQQEQGAIRSIRSLLDVTAAGWKQGDRSSAIVQLMLMPMPIAACAAQAPGSQARHACSCSVLAAKCGPQRSWCRSELAEAALSPWSTVSHHLHRASTQAAVPAACAPV